MMGHPPIKPVEATEKHQALYEAIVSAGEGLRDEEIVAVVARLMGYHIASNPNANPRWMLTETFDQNVRLAELDYRAGRVVTRR